MIINRQNGYGLAKQNLWGWLGVALVASAYLFYQLVSSPLAEADWQYWARYTARLSFACFVLVYLAAPLYQISQAAPFLWLRQNRRNAGISFGLLHSIHLGALISYFVMTPNHTNLPTIIIGGGAYGAMFAMLATSNDAAIRALGTKNWRILHKFGIHYLAVVFALTYLSSLAQSPDMHKPYWLIALAWLIILLRMAQYIATLLKGKKP